MLGFGALKSVLFQVSPGGVLLAVRARKEKEDIVWVCVESSPWPGPVGGFHSLRRNMSFPMGVGCQAVGSLAEPSCSGSQENESSDPHPLTDWQ